MAVKTLRVEPIIKRFPEVSRRIESIFLENRDALELIGERENPNEVVYADPPYVKAERTYPAEFPKQNHTLLRDLLLKYPGYAIISYNNCPLAWELYRKDFFIFSLVRENPLKKGQVTKIGSSPTTIPGLSWTSSWTCLNVRWMRNGSWSQLTSQLTR